MRRILIPLVTALALSATPASAFDVAAFTDRVFDCDGPGVEIASLLAAEIGTPETQAQGYAILSMVEMVLGDDIAPGALRDAARQQVDGVRELAIAKASSLADKCGFDTPAAPAVANPFAE